MKSYEKQLTNTPNDIRVLKVLTRMYKIGVRYDIKNRGEYKGKDIYKSMNLATRSYKLTGNIEDVKYVLSSLSRDFNTTKDYERALDQILNLPKEEIKTVDRTSKDYKVFREILGSVLSKEKDYKKKYKENNSKIKNSTLSKMMTEIAKDYNLNEE